ncbi:MAG: YicC/YloC family endoribonuclease [Acidobacteriaceae bacterium]
MDPRTSHSTPTKDAVPQTAKKTPLKTAAGISLQSPIQSMTGYARTTGVTPNGMAFTLALKSVNHRFLDLQFFLPSNMDALEMEWRRLLKEHIARGHVEVRLALERPSSTAAPRHDATAIRAYLEAFRAAAEENGITAQPDLNVAFRLPGAWNTDNTWNEEDRAAVAPAAAAAMLPLLASLDAMRTQEGRALAAVLETTMHALDALVAEVAELRDGIQQAYRQRLEQRMQELLSGPLDHDRILQEAALLADRSDVEEETARLRAHIQHFLGLLHQGGEVGKKLDFLLQEMNREANTLLSKTGGIAGKTLRLTELGLAMKTEIEKAREQVQNIE